MVSDAYFLVYIVFVDDGDVARSNSQINGDDDDDGDIGIIEFWIQEVLPLCHVRSNC